MIAEILNIVEISYISAMLRISAIRLGSTQLLVLPVFAIFVCLNWINLDTLDTDDKGDTVINYVGTDKR